MIVFVPQNSLKRDLGRTFIPDLFTDLHWYYKSTHCQCPQPTATLQAGKRMESGSVFKYVGLQCASVLITGQIVARTFAFISSGIIFSYHR